MEAFGEAMMRGMGWQEGKGVGRHPDKVVEAVEFVARPPQLGLGAAPALAPKKEKKIIRQARSPLSDMRLLSVCWAWAPRPLLRPGKWKRSSRRRPL